MEIVPLKNFKLNREGRFSITKPFESEQIVLYIKNFANDLLLSCSVITDATSCMGGDLINFSKKFKRVNGVEINKDNFELLVENCKIFECKNISLYNRDYLEIYKNLTQDIIYIDPKWGGPDYKEQKKLILFIGSEELSIFLDKLIKEQITKYIFIKVPLNAWLPERYTKCIKTIYNKKNKQSFHLICIKC